LSTADIILLVILVLGAYSGYKKGLILELIAILAFILAIIGGFKLLHIGMEYVSKVYDGFGNFLPFVAFLVLFVLILIIVNMAGNILKKIIDWTPFGVLDNFAGAVIGVIKWALMLSIVLWVMTSLSINLPEFFTKNSKILPIITGFAGQVSHFISTIFPSFENFIQTLEDLFKSFTS
jgi:membrane protein required for colicin V production